MNKSATAMGAKVESFALRMRMEKLAPGAVKGLLAASKKEEPAVQPAVSKKEINEIQEALKGMKVMGNFQSASMQKINQQNAKM